MAYTKTTWQDRSVEKPLTYTKTDNADGTITLTPAEGTILQAGTPLSAANLNNLENGVVVLDASLTAHQADNTAHNIALQTVGSRLYAYKNIGGAL